MDASVLTKIDAMIPLKSPVWEDESELTTRDLGFHFGDGWIGTCARRGWYKKHQVPETNPATDSQVLGRQLAVETRMLYLEKIKEGARHLGIKFEAMPVANVRMADELHVRVGLDGMLVDKSGSYGLLIRCGSGYGFRAEIFGTKAKAGKAKDEHLVEAWATLALTPSLSGVFIFYVDYDAKDTTVFQVVDTPEDAASFVSQATTLAGPSLPGCSYEKEWHDNVQVAKLYANGRITKSAYEKFQKTGEGGDWQCRYCPWLEKCKEDR